MNLTRFSAITALTFAAAGVSAQQQSATPPRQQPDTARKAQKAPGSAVQQGDLIVKTVPLHHLTSAQAAKLLSPYSTTPGGGAFEVPGIAAVTIREVPRVYGDMMNVLEKYDREAATVVLNFQLIAAEPTNTRDPAVANIDSLLRGVLKFSGYRLLGTAVATSGEDHIVSQTIAGDTETLSLQVSVNDIRVDGNDASVKLGVSLERPAVPATTNAYGKPRANLLSTTVTVPIGQTVLLGTSATDNGQTRALILTVRPQLAKR